MTQSHQHQHTNTGIPGVSFSWRRAIGLSRLESNVSRKIGIPLTKSGRQRKFGRIMMHLMGWAFVAGLGAAGVYAATHPALAQALLAKG
ncbi:MAG: hypothetical protein KJS97_04200 [Alphaproteobacteria bacterium]|nr:hypothetical protein [Alphaproteobacteria bacterium]